MYPAPMQKRVLVLDNSIDRATYRPAEEWSQHFGDVPFDAVHVPSGEPIPPLDRYTHLLVTGSEASARQPEPRFDVEADVVRGAVDRGLAVLGSCFGHQMLARVLSGREYVRPAPIPELGWVAVDILEPDPLLAGLVTPWHAFAAHLDEVVAPPAPWRVLAANDACAVEAMRYGDRPVWGIQPHPETPPDHARVLMQAAISQHPEYEREIRQALASPVRDDRTAAKIVAAFLAA
ncbi:MAG: type 1 glutamine amidotransferase [Thermotogota bacterium]